MITSIIANPLLLAFIALSIVTIVLLGLVLWMYIKMRRFLIDIRANDIQESLDFASNNLKDLQKFRGEMEEYLNDVETRLKRSVQSVHTVRFNPFKGTGDGGNQSFATAMLNENGDGVVISSLYSRDRVSIFSKPIKAHTSQHELSEEEDEALLNAKKGLQKKKDK